MAGVDDDTKEKILLLMNGMKDDFSEMKENLSEMKECLEKIEKNGRPGIKDEVSHVKRPTDLAGKVFNKPNSYMIFISI